MKEYAKVWAGFIKVETIGTSYEHENKFISLFNELDAQNLFHSKFYFMPLHVSSTCALNK